MIFWNSDEEGNSLIWLIVSIHASMRIPCVCIYNVVGCAKEPYVRLSQAKINSCSHQEAAVVGTPVWPGGPRRRLRIQRWPAVLYYILAPFDVFEVFLAFHPILALNCLSQVPVSARSLYFTVFLVGATSLSRDFAAPPFEIWAWEGFPHILSPIKNCFLSIYSPFRLLMCFLCGLF